MLGTLSNCFVEMKIQCNNSFYIGWRINLNGKAYSKYIIRFQNFVFEKINAQSNAEIKKWSIGFYKGS